MNKIIFVIFFIGLFFRSNAQIISTNIFVEVLKEKEFEYLFSDTSENKNSNISVFPVIVKQTINLKNYKEKQIKLFLQNLPYYNQLLFTEYYKNLEVFSIKNEIDTIPAKFNFYGDTLIVDVYSENIKLIIKYQFQSDYFLRSDEQNTILFFQPQLYGWHSWFFINNDLYLENILFSVPYKEFYFWADNTNAINDSLYKTDISEIENNNISFYIIKKQFYEEKSVTEQNVICNFYFSKGVVIDTTEVVYNGKLDKKISYIPQNTNKIIQNDKIIDKTKEAIQKIIDIFDYNKSVQLNVVDAYLTIKDFEDNLFLWGNTTKVSDNEFWLLVDTSMLSRINFHEFIHPFFDNSLSKNDIAPYFFNESVIEYVAVLLAYPNFKERDSVFNKKNEFYNTLNTNELDCKSIFKVVKNEYNMDGSQGGSSAVIYEKTPYKIHKFAEDIGSNKFIYILSQFYKNANIKREVSFSDFEKIMKQNGVTNKQWNDFITDL